MGIPFFQDHYDHGCYSQGVVFIVNDNVIVWKYHFIHDHHDHGCYSQGGKRLEVPERVSCDGANLVVAQVSEPRLLDHQTNN